MKYKEFYEKVKTKLAEYKVDALEIEEQGFFKGKEYSHILPEEYKEKNFLPTIKKPSNIKMHQYYYHLNSSQIMCINFFEKILNTNYLLDLIKDILELKIDENVTIKKAEFEKEINTKERTNFDFYIELSNGIKIFWEIKYTENGFGKISTEGPQGFENYSEKFEKVYRDHLKESLYLKEIGEKEFYKNYQINRNISYIKNKNEYVIFLIPFENETLLKQANAILYASNESKIYKNVFLVDWRDIYNRLLNILKNTSSEDVKKHYDEFFKKYLSFM